MKIVSEKIISQFDQMLFIHILIYFGIRGRIRTAYGECLGLLFKSVIHLIYDRIKDGALVPVVLVQSTYS